MNKPEPETYADWIAAMVAPWTISPHPNFSKTQIRPQEALALITEYRFHRERERYEIHYPAKQSWARDLIDAAARSVVGETQREGGADLWDLAEEERLPVGARVAAAVYAATAWGELEEADIAAERLDRIITNVGLSASAPSSALSIGVLAQQRVLRLFDSSQYSAAGDEARRVLAATPRARERGYEGFIVSDGISWGAVRVQVDIAAAIRAHATSALSSVEFLSGQTWVQVVRARRGWIDYRMRGLAAERDSLAVRDAFEAKLESTSGTQHFMRTGPVEAGYESLLVAELSGNPAAVSHNREQLGKILLLQNRLTDHDAREALRLLRQGRASKPLQSALTWLRNEGPTSSIVGQATAIMDRAFRAGWVTEADLLVLESAAEFLDSDQRALAIKAAFNALTTEMLGRQADWSSHDKVWRAVGRLAPEAHDQNFIAERALEYTATPDRLFEPLTSRLADVLNDLQWESITSGVIEAWREWATTLADGTNGELAAAGSREEEIRVLREVVLRHTANLPESAPEEPSLQRAAFLADNGVPAGEDIGLRATSVFLVNALRNEAAQARMGAISFGGYSTAEVAVAYAIQFTDMEVWQAVTDHLTDENVDGALKASALDRIARFADRLPPEVTHEIRSRFAHVLNSPRKAGLFRSTSGPVFAEALRVGGALGALGPVEIVQSVMQLGAGDTGSRVQAAKTIPFVIRAADATWAHALLLQLSLDANPMVRAEAAAALVRTLRWDSSLRAQVRERVSELVTSQGVRIPFFTIQAIRAEARDASLDIEFLRPALAAAAAESSPRIVARAASLALDGADD